MLEMKEKFILSVLVLSQTFLVVAPGNELDVNSLNS